VTTLAVFTRDLRVHDNPMLAAAAAEAEHTVPLFVLDPAMARPGFAGGGRQRFLAESLADLDRSLRGLGGRLVVRAGDPVEQVCRIADEVNAGTVHLAADCSGYAQRREEALHRQADQAADDAIRYKRPVALDAMTASERKLVHEYLRDRGDVETYSEGEEPDRHLMVAPLR